MSPKKEKVHIAPHQLWPNREEFPVQAHQIPHHPFIYGSIINEKKKYDSNLEL